MHVRTFAALLALTGSLLACDPEGAGASGSITLGAGVDPGMFITLAIRVFPDGKVDFDPASVSGREKEEGASDIALQGSDHGGTGTTLAFPHGYTLGEVLGTSPHGDWRMVAWLSQQKPLVTGIVAGDVFCTRRFKVDGCGLAGGYCKKTTGVDCTLDQNAR